MLLLHLLFLTGWCPGGMKTNKTMQRHLNSPVLLIPLFCLEVFNLLSSVLTSVLLVLHLTKHFCILRNSIHLFCESIWNSFVLTTYCTGFEFSLGHKVEGGVWYLTLLTSDLCSQLSLRNLLTLKVVQELWVIPVSCLTELWQHVFSWCNNIQYYYMEILWRVEVISEPQFDDFVMSNCFIKTFGRKLTFSFRDRIIKLWNVFWPLLAKCPAARIYLEFNTA